VTAIESVCPRLADDVSETLGAGETPLVLGGDHSVAIGSVVGSARDADVGTLWFDAHGDLNTPATTPSGNVHGMALAAILGLREFAGTPWADAAGVDPDNVAVVGVRDLDPGDREAIREHDIDAFSISEVDDRGITGVVADTLDAACGRDGVHVSLDLDWLDPTEAPGVGTRPRGRHLPRGARGARTGRRRGDGAVARTCGGDPGPRRSQPDRGVGGRTRRECAGKTDPVGRGVSSRFRLRPRRRPRPCLLESRPQTPPSRRHRGPSR